MLWQEVSLPDTFYNFIPAKKIKINKKRTDTLCCGAQVEEFGSDIVCCVPWLVSFTVFSDTVVSVLKNVPLKLHKDLPLRHLCGT